MTTSHATVARRVTGAVAAIAITLAGMTATATPARAQNNDLARFALGVTALAIIGTAIANANQNNHRPAPQPVHPVRPHHPTYPVYPVNPPSVVHPPRRHHEVRLPAQCEIHVGRATYYGERCLQQAGFGRLPQHCAQQVQGPRGGWRVVYEGRCLQQGGGRGRY